MRKFGRHPAFIGWFLAAFLLGSNTATSAAPIIGFSSIKSGCGVSYSTGVVHSQRYVATKSVTMKAINVLVGTGNTANFASGYYYILGNNNSTNYPTTVLETFTPDVISGSGVNTVARYIGNYTFTLGSKIWIAGSQLHSTFPTCYSNPTTASELTLNGIALDTSTSGSNSSFRRAYIYASPASGTAWSSTFDDGLVFQLSIELGTVDPISATVGLANGLPSASYRQTNTLKANVSSPSLVTFYVNKKVVANCRKIPSSAGVANCNWKPSQHGAQAVQVKATPTDSSATEGLSQISYINVVSRTNNR